MNLVEYAIFKRVLTTAQQDIEALGQADKEIADEIETLKEELTTLEGRLLVGTEAPTTDTCPIGCWYGVYEE